jgi:hypothetical protein
VLQGNTQRAGVEWSHDMAISITSMRVPNG